MLRLTDGAPLDAEIQPLCVALAAAGCTTIYSCGAHLTAEPPRRRAYVTFACGDARWVRALRDYLLAPEPVLDSLRRELRYECFQARYTVAIWAPADAEARAALDYGLATLTAWVLDRPRPQITGKAVCGVVEERWPEMVPCRLTLDAPPARCGWTGAPLGNVS